MTKEHAKGCTFCCKGIGYRLKKYVVQLQQMANGSPKVRRNMLQKADPCFIGLLRECVINVLRKRVDGVGTSTRDRKKLSRYAPKLVRLAKPKTSLRKSRQLLKQTGGFLPIILPAILSLITSVAGDAIGRTLKR